jgi:diphthine-ammonia ligase
MKVGVLFSGGKDSCYAMHRAMEKHEVACLISVISRNPESYMFHVPNIWITGLQAEAIGLPLIRKETEGRKEEELEDLELAMEEARDRFGIRGIVTGAVESVYQSERVKGICDSLGLACINPLWKRDQEEMLRDMVRSGFRIIVSGVFAYKLDDRWLGREMDSKAIRELVALRERYAISPAGEGGEIETTVLDAPFFRKRIEVLESEKRMDGDSGVFVIKKARLAGKRAASGRV